MNMVNIGLLVILIIGGEGAQKCLNEYRYVMSIKYGRHASVNPDRDVYYPDDVVRFRCPAGYYFQSPFYRGHQEMWIKCLKGHRWLENWPICRGPLENVTCENQYLTAESHGRHWLNQTVNEFHADYYPKLTEYRYGKTLRFTCPGHSSIFRTRGLTVMTTECLKDGQWSNEWPMCKGQTCKYKYVKHGIINDKNIKLSVGIKLNITCEPGYYLWGPNQTMCLRNLEWSGYPQECITIEKFQRNCQMDQHVMKIKHEGYQQKPYCYYQYIERGSNHYKIAVGISVPMAIGFIIFIVTASFYVKHQRIKMSRERASYIRQQHRQNRLLLSLPSYEDAVKSIPTTPPPTFAETFGVGVVIPEDQLLVPSEDNASNYTEAVITDLPPQYNDNNISHSQMDLPPVYTETAFLSEPSASDISPEYPDNLEIPSSTQVSELSPEYTEISSSSQASELTPEYTEIPSSSQASGLSPECTETLLFQALDVSLGCTSDSCSTSDVSETLLNCNGNNIS